jgi:parallel beta-helix repeat protein
MNAKRLKLLPLIALLNRLRVMPDNHSPHISKEVVMSTVKRYVQPVAFAVAVLTACWVGFPASAYAAPAQQIIVAKDGGEFTTISEALAAITPTADNPYVIDVMPGVYVESILLKSYVHLRGAGQDVTVIQSSGYYAVRALKLSGTTISGFTIRGGSVGIDNSDSSLIIENNRIRENAFGIHNSNTVYSYTIFTIIRNNKIEFNTNYGITNYNSAPLIADNIIYQNGYHGIYNAYSYRGRGRDYGMIKGNRIILNGYSGIVTWFGSSPAITGNTISRNDIGINVSVNGTMLGTSPHIEHNDITENWTTDIYVYSGTPRISFNVVDRITGAGGRRVYNDILFP